MDERALRIRRLSKGILDNRITDADILSIAIQSSSAKRKKLTEESRKDEIPLVNKPFNIGACDPATKENIPSIPVYPASPYKALQGFYEKQHQEKIKETIESSNVQESKSLFETRLESTLSQPGHVSQKIDVEPQQTYSEIVVPEFEPTEVHEKNNEKISVGKLRSLVFDHLLEVLNHGNYEDLTALKGIGKVRALRIFTIRNAGGAFECVDDLEAIGMNSKNIEKFVIENVGGMLGKI